MEFLDTGRGPGKKPPFSPILKWAMEKTGQPASECWGLARYVQNKIAALGTEIFMDNRKGIELEKKVVNLKQSINENIGKQIKTEIIQKLDRFKEIYKFNLSQ